MCQFTFIPNMGREAERKPQWTQLAGFMCWQTPPCPVFLLSHLNKKGASVLSFPFGIPFNFIFLSFLLLQVFLHCQFQAKVERARGTQKNITLDEDIDETDWNDACSKAQIQIIYTRFKWHQRKWLTGTPVRLHCMSANFPDV